MNPHALDRQVAANLQGNFDEGWRIAEELERQSPQDDRAAFNRGWHYLQRGDFHKGMELIDRGRKIKVFGNEPPPGDKPQWDGNESLQGKTVLLNGEGGFGDEIIHVRFAKDLAARGARVVVACHPGLMSLFRRVEGVSQVVPHSDVASAVYDVWVPAMSAAYWLGTTYETLSGAPYITANAQAVTAWKSIVRGPELKVGIRWSGNPKFEHEQHRKFPVEPLLELATLPNVKLYSLQRDNDIRDLPPAITDLQHLLASWEDTAAAIANLDIVITSCTATAHLAGAMGKETWVIAPVLPYYIWALPGEKSSWYNSVRLFRQMVFGTWDKPLTAVRDALNARAAGHAPVAASELGAVATVPQPEPFRPLIIPGMAFAPHPKQKGTRRATKYTLHFVAGFPRCGSTALMSLLAQNPRIFSAPISGMCGIFGGIYANWDKNEFHQELPNPAAKRRMIMSVLDNYHDTDRPVVLDKDRMWVVHAALLEELLERPVKFIVPVRPIPEVLASFETLRRRDPLQLTGADSAIGAGSTIQARAAYYAGAGGALGVAYNATKDAVTQGYLDRMLFVDYNKLTSAPKAQLKRIYEFLEEPYYEHELSEVKQVAHGDWRVHQLPGLHDIRPVFKKESRPAREVLGADVYAQYDQPEPWSQWT